MTTLLELKEKLVRFYGKYEVYITPIVMHYRLRYVWSHFFCLC